MITVEKEVLVERPADEVFDFLADVRNEERWNPNVLRIESEADGPLAVEGTFEGVYRRGGRMRFELVEAVRPSRLVFRGGGRQMALVGTLEREHSSKPSFRRPLTSTPPYRERSRLRRAAPDASNVSSRKSGERG
jgi:uncharacterized protein YndB with AHSA1/START domain